jgi:hypothetical protein
LSRFIAQLAMWACVWSAVQMTTALMSFWSRQLPPVGVGLGAGEASARRLGEVELVDVAEGDDVLLLDGLVVREAAAPDADEGDVEFVAGASRRSHASPVAVLRWASIGGALTSALATHAIASHWPSAAVLALIQFQALFATPTWSLVTSITLAGLREPTREFGPVRAFGTFGWIGGCLLISAIGADASTRAGVTTAIGWIAVAATSWSIPNIPPPPAVGRQTIRERLGLDALGLLRRPEYRVLFLTAGLAAIPLAAFYPFAPAHLRDLGFQHTSAWMSLAQATEILAMFSLAGWLGRWGTKRILAAGLTFAVLRYVLLATDQPFVVLPGIALHGFAFTLFFVTAPICLNHTMDPAWRTRAQALLSLSTQGVGNLVGYLGTGAWLAACTQPDGTQWSWFWGGLAVLVALVLAYFQATFRDRPSSP